jgi:hypothetical protein
MMARTKNPKKKFEKDPLSEYNSVPISYQLVCYKFWCHLEYGGGERWNPDVTPNSVKNWRNLSYIKENIRQSSFPNIAKVS